MTLSAGMAHLRTACNCNQRQINAALESELLASKEVNVLQVLEGTKSLVYTNLLQDEIGKRDLQTFLASEGAAFRD